ncbi:MAG: glucose 1-dehydrogenase [Ruminiclostridium sp.]|nr:glucose 1-dehydrogenase [Ruminiclostridium sp.]
MKLINKAAIVTGASKGLGAGIAIALANQGADLVINYSSDNKGAEETAQQIRSTGRTAYICKADVSKYDEIESMINYTIEKFGRLDILINNAGIAIWKPFFEITEDIWDRTLDTNLKSVFMASQLAGRQMCKNGGGVIVNISSIAAHGAMDCLVPYCASKGGMTLLTKAMAVELAPYKIRVNSVAPGTIDIKRNRDIDPDYPDDWIPYIPLGRVGTVEDIAGPVVFLCSGDSGYMTGQTIQVSGGELEYVPMPGSDFARK